MNEDIFIIQLRACFTAGYTLPQFCIDNNIKNPLFIAVDERRADFLWEIFVQFKYDKRIIPNFILLNGKTPSINFSLNSILSAMKFENPADINYAKYDGIIVLNAIRLNVNIHNVIYLDQLLGYFITRTYAEVPLLHFLQRHSGVKLIVITHPNIHEDVNNTERENQFFIERASAPIFKIRDQIKNSNGKQVSTPYDFLGYSNEEVYDLLESPDNETNLDGSTSLINNSNEIINIRNGKRSTAYQPEQYENKIYFVGNCVFYGFGVPFQKTVESHLQKILNENNLPYRVENESQPFSGRYQDIFYNLNKLDVKEGDIIFICLQDLLPKNILCWDLRRILDRPHNYGEVFADFCHVNELGHYALAEKFFQFLTQNNFFKNTKFEYLAPLPPHRYGIPKEYSAQVAKNFDSKELETHKQKLREKRVKVGCIVINANPFTLGHEHLVKYAAARVHKLFIMVVSEDKSEFPFADRFEMVKRGTEKFPNVEVLPSGQFVISQKTFSGYFNKENLQDVQVDSSQDVEIFASEIAPALGVNIRFVGEEPEDTVTKTYNDNMKNILPRYDIEVCEIPRKEINGEVISAKSVRAALRENNLDKLKKLVPATTLDYIHKKYFRK